MNHEKPKSGALGDETKKVKALEKSWNVKRIFAMSCWGSRGACKRKMRNRCPKGDGIDAELGKTRGKATYMYRGPCNTGKFCFRAEKGKMDEDARKGKQKKLEERKPGT